MTPRRTLGYTGLEVSVVGLGTVKLGRNTGVKYPQSFNLPTDLEIEKLLKKAKQLGINLLDTAPAYGNSEERLGQYFKKMDDRKDWIITTKFGEQFINHRSFFDFTQKAALKSIHKSLSQLQTDYLDLVLVHSNGDDIEIIQKYDVFDTLSELKKAGKIRAFGMSTKTVAGGLLAVEKSDVTMVCYNPMDITDRPVIDYACKLGKGILIKKALASGHLPHLSHEENPIQKSLHFILQTPGVSSIIIGTLSPQHLTELVSYTQET